MTITQKRWAIVGGVVAILAVLGVFGARKKPLEVKTVRVSRGLVERTVSSTSSGSVKARLAADLKSEIVAKVLRHEVNEGDKAKKDDPLVTLDTATFAASLTLNEASRRAQQARVEQARARLENARQDHDRIQNLYKEQIVAEDRLQAAKTALDVAEQELSAARSLVEQLSAQIEMDRVNLSRGVIRAPFDGVIVSLDMDPGETAIVGTRLVRIVNNEDVYVEAPIDESDLGLLKLGQDVRVTFDAFPKETFTGKLSFISPSVTIDSTAVRTVAVRVILDSVTGRMRDGMSADVEIIVEKLEAVPFVPTQAVIATADETYVYVVENKRVAKRVIQPGISNWDRTEVRSGLGDSDHVIMAIDRREISEGNRVKEELSGDPGHAAR
ncbi:MAG: efflux RND transporter periplasmic adaptor subunit [Deltaproteobacteria bacterium]|nr:efflux RND transporter periplasmic adaptor subunit [Deltaproteobacteria bacterium]